MYESFYGLKTKPFSLLPDPDFLYLGKQHKVAFALLEYALMNNAGFCVITGEIGTGKTTLCRKLLNKMDDKTKSALILNPSFSELQLLQIQFTRVKLSEKRARAVVELLTTFGVPEAQLVTNSYGASLPLQDVAKYEENCRVLMC